MKFRVEEQAGDENTIMLSRAVGAHTNTRMVWVMTRGDLENLKSKIETYLDGEE